MKKGILSILGCWLVVFSFSQNNPPVAVDDTVEVMSQVATLIDVLANDYDADGDGIAIQNVQDGVHGTVDTIEGKIRYKSDPYTGTDHASYRIADDGNPPLNSSFAEVTINVLSNPHAPIVKYDTFNLLELEPAELEILANDNDPDGDEIKILQVFSFENCDVSLHNDSMRVTVTPMFASYHKASFSYRIIEKNTDEQYISNSTEVYIKILTNPDIPVLVPDTAYTTGGIPVTIPVLENDYDHQGEPFEIFTYTQPSGGQVTLSGNDLQFTPDISFEGHCRFRYRAVEIWHPWIYTDNVYVDVWVSKNPDCPVGVPDQASGTTFQPMIIEVMVNDYDPNGMEFELWDVESDGTDIITDNKISHTSSPLAIGHETIYYRIRQTKNFAYYSEWTPVYIDLAVNPELPVAVDDHASGNIYYPVTISPMANDIDNGVDSLVLRIVETGNGQVNQISDSLIAYQAYPGASSLDSVRYEIYNLHNYNLRAQGNIYIDIADHHFNDSLDMNNINAGVNADGILFYNEGNVINNYAYDRPHFKFPAGAETNTIFSSSIWIGGVTEQDSVYFAKGKSYTGGSDTQTGPVSDIYDTNFALKYFKLWKLNKSDIDYHSDHWSLPGYQPIRDLAEWPGNGTEGSGEADQLAPYFDYDRDGKYDPFNGDYPLIRGDQCIFFMLNDDKSHEISFGNRMKVEIHGMAYAYDAPEDSALNNTVFVHYDLINRSDRTYLNTYAGIFTDFDMADNVDDFVGSNVRRSSYYCYNGDPFDEDIRDYSYSIKGYGEFPPAQSVTVLAGPFIDPDGTDDPSGGCDFSVNGINFGNGINDDERLGLTNFWYVSTEGPQHTIYPREYYYMMQTLRYDGTPWPFGSGYFPPSGPGCRFMFPGDSDPLNWGTDCIVPNPPYDQAGIYWTDSCANFKGARYGLGSMGPFTFAPGQVQEIDLAYCAANGWNGPASSVDKLMEYIDTLRSRVNNGEIIIPNSSLGITEKKISSALLKIYPNPASTYITIQSDNTFPSGSEYLIYNILGETVLSGRIASGKQVTLNISVLQQGFYLVKMNAVGGQCSGKFIRQ